MSEFDSDLNTVGKWYLKVIAGVLGLFMIVGTLGWWATRTAQVVDTGIVRYEEFQNKYNAVKQFQDKICALKQVDEKDPMFRDFSKSQQILNLTNNMTRHVNDYNADSAKINFNLWKSKELPQTLTVQQFTVCQ